MEQRGNSVALSLQEGQHLALLRAFESMSMSLRLAVAAAGWLGSVHIQGLLSPSAGHHTVTCCLVIHGTLTGSRSLGCISISPSVDSTAVFGNALSGC